MEQIEIVLEGKALWEVGEFEREVGPGDVIFTPRFVKHGYKVLGDKPFKFLQLEWRNYRGLGGPCLRPTGWRKEISTKGHEGPRRHTKKE